MMPRIPVPLLWSVVELFSSETRYGNNDGGCPPVGTPRTRPSCSRQSTFTWNSSSSSRSFERSTSTW
eukprot:1310532-Pleurochrysis_carterae.AAC.1